MTVLAHVAHTVKLVRALGRLLEFRLRREPGPRGVTAEAGTANVFVMWGSPDSQWPRIGSWHGIARICEKSDSTMGCTMEPIVREIQLEEAKMNICFGVVKGPDPPKNSRNH